MITKETNKLPILIFDLDNLMNKRNTTEENLAKISNLPISLIQKIRENKIHQIDIQVLEKLCYYLNCQPSDIIKFNEKE